MNAATHTSSDADDGQTLATRPTTAKRPLSGYRVLVVDDEPALASLLGRVVGRTHDVRIATGGAEAWSLIQRATAARPVTQSTSAISDPPDHTETDWRPHAIVTDLAMPDLSGIELYRRVAALAPDLAERFIFTTGGAFTDEMEAFLRRSGAQFLEKPFPPSQLEQLLTNILSPLDIEGENP